MNSEEIFFNNLGNKFSVEYQFPLNKLTKIFNFNFNSDCYKNTLDNFDEYISLRKRKNTGSFYTPEFLAKYLVKKSLYLYLSKNTCIMEEKISKLIFDDKNDFLNSEMLELKEKISEIIISDFSSGTGIFLLSYYLIVKKIVCILKFEEKETYLKNIIVNNIYAFDINSLAINSLILFFNSRLFDLGFNKFHELNCYNINSITDESLENIIPNKKFDLILGNPPYIGEKGNKNLFSEIRKSKFGKKFYEGKMDLFYYFIYRGILSLNETGILTYLTTNYFITANGAKKLRSFMKKNGSFIKIINFNNNKIFKSAKGLHNMVFFFSKEKNIDPKIVNICEKNDIKKLCKNNTLSNNLYSISNYDLHKNDLINIYVNKEHYSIIKKIHLKSNLVIKDFFNVNQGLVSGADYVTKYSYNNKLNSQDIAKYKININDPIFVLKNKDINNFKGKKYLKKFYKNSDIRSFSVNYDTDKYILYIDNNVNIDQTLKNHLMPFKSILKKRREVKLNRRKWYQLQWYRDAYIFESEKIVMPQRSIKNTFAYSNKPFYGSADIYYLTKKNLFLDYDLKVLLGLLNSKLFYLYLFNLGKKKGKNLELYATPIKNLVINKFSKKEENLIKSLVDILINNFNKKDYNKLNKIIYKSYNLKNKEIEFIENYYEGVFYE